MQDITKLPLFVIREMWLDGKLSDADYTAEVQRRNDEILSLRSRAEKAEAERDEARRKLFPYADATEISGISWDGKYLIGDKKSIAYFHEMKNRGEQIDVYRRAFDERKAALEADKNQALDLCAAAVDDYNNALATCEKLAAALELALDVLTAEDGCDLAPIIGSDNPNEHAAGLVAEALAAYRKEAPDAG